MGAVGSDMVTADLEGWGVDVGEAVMGDAGLDGPNKLSLS